MRNIVKSGEVPGILAYAGQKPVGWCAVAPRGSFPALNRSRILKKVDDIPVWSIVCFFVDRTYRDQGVSVRLLKAAIEYGRRQGGEVLEGYPVEPKKGRIPAAFAWTGVASAFQTAGFIEVSRRSETRPIMRYIISKG
jgi:GNAT superfamily N-acetyltransferase